jgi:hypothetical protein
MPTSHISTPLASVSPSIVIAALHNHDLMIKTLCPALISYNFESGDKSTCATYSITDRKPIGQVRSIHFQIPSTKSYSTTLTLPPSDNIQTHPHKRPRRRRQSCQRQAARGRAHDFGEVEGQEWGVERGGGYRCEFHDEEGCEEQCGEDASGTAC